MPAVSPAFFPFYYSWVAARKDRGFETVPSNTKSESQDTLLKIGFCQKLKKGKGPRLDLHHLSGKTAVRYPSFPSFNTCFFFFFKKESREEPGETELLSKNEVTAVLVRRAG